MGGGLPVEIGASWEEWKDVLGRAVDTARTMGMSDERIENLAYQVGEYLAAHARPASPEQRVLRELWGAGNEEEKKTLARLVARVVDGGTNS